MTEKRYKEYPARLLDQRAFNKILMIVSCDNRKIYELVNDTIRELPLAPDCSTCVARCDQVCNCRQMGGEKISIPDCESCEWRNSGRSDCEHCKIIEAIKAWIKEQISKYDKTNRELKLKILDSKTPEAGFVFSDILEHNRTAIDILNGVLPLLDKHGGGKA